MIWWGWIGCFDGACVVNDSGRAHKECRMGLVSEGLVEEYKRAGAAADRCSLGSLRSLTHRNAICPVRFLSLISMDNNASSKSSVRHKL